MWTRTSHSLTGLGVLAACAVAVKAAHVVWTRCEIALGHVHVRKYKGRWALVTGGSEGLGKAIAASLASYGMHVILVSRSQAKLDAAQQELQAKHPYVQVRTMSCDVSKADGCKQLLQQLSDTDIACLVANAGGGASKGPIPYWEYTETDEAAIYGVNGTSTYTLVRGLLPRMMERGSGAIVGISSLMYKWGTMAVPYASEKAKINAFMEALDAELKLSGFNNITAQAMIIGGVVTPAILKLRNPQLSEASPAEVSAALAAAEANKGSSGLMRASADAAGDAVVRAIGKGGPLVTPYWRHALAEYLLMDMWWLPALQRGVKRSWTRKMMEALSDQSKKAV